MILRDTSKLAVDTVDKSLVVFKIFSKKIWKFGLYYQVFSFGAIFIFIILLNYWFIEKQDAKKDLVSCLNLSNFKIVFILFAKMVVI